MDRGKSMTTFEYPQFFWLLLFPFAVFFLFPKTKGIYGDALKVPFLKDIKYIQAKSEQTAFPALGSRAWLSVKYLYLFSLWVLLVIAAARPQHVGEPYRLKAENRDIMLVIDISPSMLQPDLSRTQRIDRLTAVKAVVGSFVQKRTEDRLGLILFGTRAYVQSPLTFDKNAVAEILNNADAGMAGNSTSIGDALGLALKNLREEKEKNNKVIILLTDGENNDGSLSMAQAIGLAEKEGIKTTILSGDRDTFQLASKNITIRIPRTKMGKTETEDYDESKIEEEYGIKPVQLIQVKGLMGDASDNIPGVPGVGEKTALKLIKEYQNIDKLYEELESGNTTIKGALKEKLTNNKESAILSRTLGTILLDAPLDVEVKDLAVKDWNKEAVTNKFKELRFNRFIERFDLNGLGTAKVNKKIDDLFKIEEADIKKILEVAKESKELIYYFEKEKMQTNGLIINESIKSISIYDRKANTVYYSKNIDVTTLKNLFEDSQVEKASYKVKTDYILLKQEGIGYNNIKYDAEIAGYNLNPTCLLYTSDAADD